MQWSTSGSVRKSVELIHCHHFCPFDALQPSAYFLVSMMDMIQLDREFWSKIAWKYDPVVDQYQ